MLQKINIFPVFFDLCFSNSVFLSILLRFLLLSSTNPPHLHDHLSMAAFVSHFVFFGVWRNRYIDRSVVVMSMHVSA